MEAAEANWYYFFEDWLIKPKCYSLLNMQSEIWDQKSQYVYLSEPIYFIRFNLRHPVYRPNRQYEDSTGTLPLRRFFGPRKNRVRGKPHYRRSILVLKPQNVEYESSKSTFWAKCTTCKINKSGECSKCHVKIRTNFLPL